MAVTPTQTEYPVLPDTSMDAYYKANLKGYRNNALGRFWATTFDSAPTYNQWRENEMTRYNAQLQEYNQFLQTQAGQKAAAQEAGYNPAWLDGASGAGSSALEYQSVPDPAEQVGPAIANMIPGISQVMQVLSGLEQIRGMKLKNAAQGISNQYLEASLKQKLLGARFNNLIKSFGISSELFSRDPTNANTVYYDPTTGAEIFVDPHTNRGLNYQESYNEVEAIKKLKELRKYQAQAEKWDAQQKEYYYTEILPIMKEYWLGKKEYASVQAQLMTKQVENQNRNRTLSTVAGVGLAILKIVSFFVPGLSTVVEQLDINPDTGEIFNQRQTTTSQKKP